MLRTNQKNSVYGEYINEQITIIGQQGGGLFSFQDIAAKLGLKPTHNLRKRLRTAEKKGSLVIGMAYRQGSGTFLTYEIPEMPRQLHLFDEIPF